MSHLHHFNFGININPPLQSSTAVGIQYTPAPLGQIGVNFLIEISTASAYLALPSPPERKTISVMAHLDTGASTTSIEHNIASHLGLFSIGRQRISTANGTSTVDSYPVDLAFLNSSLKGFQNFRVSSCQMAHFNLEDCLQNPNKPKNFGVLIGRDVMSRWHITWHGPTSTVFISD